MHASLSSVALWSRSGRQRRDAHEKASAKVLKHVADRTSGRRSGLPRHMIESSGLAAPCRPGRPERVASDWCRLGLPVRCGLLQARDTPGTQVLYHANNVT